MVAPLLPGQRPPTEDDPLYQWRLRRRMELAQQATPTHAPKFDFLSKTEQQVKHYRINSLSAVCGYVNSVKERTKLIQIKKNKLYTKDLCILDI